MGSLFGTDGVRGIANSELTPNLAFNLGKAGAYVLSKANSNAKPVFVIGADTRISGDMLENALCAGILSVGGNVIKLGVIPTPAVAFLVRYFKADAGVMISASHNPFEYNGIKFFNGEGYKLDDSIEEKIEETILREPDTEAAKIGDGLGRCIEAEDDALRLYADFLLSTVKDLDLTGKKVVLDCANGASYRVAEMVYSDLGATTIMLGNEPNGININQACGSTHPENLQGAVIREQADIGLAYDGDADRLIAVADNGELIDGDKIMCICAAMLKKQGQLEKNLLTATVMSNLGLHKYMEKQGIDVEVTGVGDRYVLESMLKTGSCIGGEQSGHVIFLDHTTTGDGIMSSLQLVQAIAVSGKTSSRLAEDIIMYPQVLRNAIVKNENKKKYKEDDEVVAAITQVEEKMAGEGRVLIRPSGTEPLVRVMLEGDDVEKISDMAEGLAELLTRKFG